MQFLAPFKNLHSGGHGSPRPASTPLIYRLNLVYIHVNFTSLQLKQFIVEKGIWGSSSTSWSFWVQTCPEKIPCDKTSLTDATEKEGGNGADKAYFLLSNETSTGKGKCEIIPIVAFQNPLRENILQGE